MASRLLVPRGTCKPVLGRLQSATLVPSSTLVSAQSGGGAQAAGPKHVHTPLGCDSALPQLQPHAEIGADAGMGRGQASGAGISKPARVRGS